MRSRAARAIARSTASRPRGHRLLAGILAAVAMGAGLVALAPSAALADSNEGAFLAHLNSLRSAHGLAPLALAGDLTSVARAHSAQMAAKATIFHNSTLTSTVANWQTLGENVGMGPTVSAIDNAFDASPSHYANEVNTSYTQVGIGSVTDNRGEIFVTLDFRRPMNATSAPAAAPKAPTPVRTTTTATATRTTPTKSTSPVASAARSTASANTTPTAVPAAPRPLTPAQKAALAGVRAAAARHAAAAAREYARLQTLHDPLARAIVFQQTVTRLH